MESCTGRPHFSDFTVIRVTINLGKSVDGRHQDTAVDSLLYWFY